MSAVPPAQATILLVDDTLENLNFLITCLEETGFRIAVARSGKEALERVAYAVPDLILLDVMMPPGMDGFETCRRLKANAAFKEIPVIFMTVASDIIDKMQGFEVGGVDYMTKPVQPEEVVARIRTHLTIRELQQELQARNALLQEKNEQLHQEIAIRKQTEDALHQSKFHVIELKHERDQLAQENITLRTGMGERYKFGDLIGRSAAMQQVYVEIVQAAASDANVLICGESGTGKEIAARTIHQLSARQKYPFVPINCGTVPETLFEREFFGHCKGAFTDATMDKPGYFDQAHGGTLFLDEVAELPPALQVKLLRALEYKEYIPLGSTQNKHVDVRIISATNKDVKAYLREGLIRKDFFYRIRILVITLPPLRERREDIPLLIEHFLKLYAGETAHAAIPGKLLSALCGYDWPGNVRELQNELQRYLAGQRLEFIGTSLTEFDIGEVNAQFGFDPPHTSFHEAVAAFEKHLILNTLAQNAGQRGKTAQILGIPTKTLYNKLKKYGVELPE